MPNAAVFARVLYSMHETGTLRVKACKPAVKLFIRQSSEEGLWSLNAQYRSFEAGAIIDAHEFRTASAYHDFCRDKKNGLTHEHMIPGEAVYGCLTKHPNPTVSVFETILLKTGFRAIITQEEDRRLLRSAMPEGYSDALSEHFDHRARYLAADPAIELQALPPEGWLTGGRPYQSRAQRAALRSQGR